MHSTRRPLWSLPVPHALGTTPQDVPTLATFLPEKPTGSAIVVCPGGGYQHLATHEDTPFCQWLNTLGVTAFSLHYRLGPTYKHPVMLGDVARAIRTVRHSAPQLGIDPGRIGVMGFSAGGHLASSISVHFDAGDPHAADPIDRCSSRPDVSVLVYPVITMGRWTHEGSRQNLLGPGASAGLIETMSSERQVTPQTPPAFLYHRTGDAAVPSQNPLQYALALANAGVRYELHVYDHAGHGQGFAADDPIDGDWSAKLASWLNRMGF